MINNATFNISCENDKQQISYWYFNKIVSFINTFNTSITGLLSNTTYTCCVLAVKSYEESEPICQNITITSLNTITTELTIIYNFKQYLYTSIVCMYFLHMTNYTDYVYYSYITKSVVSIIIVTLLTQLINTISDIIMHTSLYICSHRYLSHH